MGTELPDKDVLRDSLRKRAEKQAHSTRTDIDSMSAEDVQGLVHELQIHQIELELQNEERANAFAELELAHDRYVDLYHFAPVGYLSLSEDGVILDANLTAASILHKTRADLIDSKFALCITRDDRDQLFKEMRRLKESPEQRVSFRISVESPAGVSTIHLDSVTRIREGQFQYRVTLSDVTKTRQLEEALAEKTQQLAWMNALPLLICYLDQQLGFQYGNAAHDAILKGPPAISKGKHIREVYPQDLYEPIEYALQKALAGSEATVEVTIRRQSLEKRRFEVIYIPDLTSEGEVIGIHGLYLDVTDRNLIAAQEERRRQFEQLLQQLTDGERQVYTMLIQGKENKAIAHSLDIGLRTVERRRQSLLQKLDVESLTLLLQKISEI